jgi:23S rRNA (guanosine2251-2'-O)-methyltransferase
VADYPKRKLKPDRLRSSTKTEIIYGIHPVHEALRAGKRKFHALFVDPKATSKRLVDLVDAVQNRHIPVERVPAIELNRLAGTLHHQGLAARVGAYGLAELGDILAEKEDRFGDPFLILLDNVLDPQNFGAVVRTGVCAGIDGIIIPKDRSVGPTPTVSKASAGALEHGQIVRVTNLVRTIRKLKDRGIWIYGLEPSAAASIYSANLTEPVGLIIGGEEKGMRPLVRKNCDHLVSIPHVGPVDSLNASVAAALAIYEVFRQRLSTRRPR